MIVDGVRSDGVTAWNSVTVPRCTEGLAEMVVNCSNHYNTDHIKSRKYAHSHHKHRRSQAGALGAIATPKNLAELQKLNRIEGN